MKLRINRKMKAKNDKLITIAVIDVSCMLYVWQ